MNQQFSESDGELVLDLVVNQQFSKSVGELVLDLVVNPQFSKKVGELVLDLDIHHHISNFFVDWENQRNAILWLFGGRSSRVV